MVTGRFAPTPSGRLHLGNVLCAMLAYLSARTQGGRFLLRIEDVDVPRCPRRLAQRCIEDLSWLGFDWDGPIIWQSERAESYRRALAALAERGLTYPCFCTRAELHPENAPNLGDTQVVYNRRCASLTSEEISAKKLLRRPAIRLRVPDADVRFTDCLQGEVCENLERDCGDFVLQRSDGLFGYQLAVVVDDADSKVTEVVRGRDILSSTPRQIYLQRCLGYAQPDYIHIPLLTDADGRRLAKREGDTDLTALSRKYTAEELIGLLACAAGLLEEPRPSTLKSLIPLFDWHKVPASDIRLPSMR